MKKFLSFILALSFVLTSVPICLADNTGIFSYTLMADGSYEVTSYKGNGQEQVNIPSEYLGSVVTAISSGCFTTIDGDTVTYHPEIKTITIPYTISSIGENAFAGTSWIDTAADEKGFVTVNGILLNYTGSSSVLTLPDNIKTINYGAFAGNEWLSGIKLTYGLTKILDNAFSGCVNLNTIDIPDSVVYIGGGAFRNTAITTITIPNGVTEVNASLFYCCDKLTTVNFAGSVSSFGQYCFCECKALESITINSENPNVFPACVHSIGYGAFLNCINLQNVKIGSSVASIGSLAFANCVKLSDFYVSEECGMTEIGDYAFGFYILYDGESYTPIRISTTIHISGTTLGRINTPIIKYCHNAALEGIFTPVSYVVSYPTLLGDTDGDKKITASDARLILRCAAELITIDEKYAIDVNLDGRISAGDARRALRIAAGLDTNPENLEE